MSALTSVRLAELTLQALERTAFMMGDAVEANPKERVAAGHSATISYRGPTSGTVTLNAGDDFLRGLASNLLGVEPEEVQIDEHGEDAIKELTNIVAGLIITELGGSECKYSLGLPDMVRTPPAAEPAGKNGTSQCCCLDCEGQMLFVDWNPNQGSLSVPV